MQAAALHAKAIFAPFSREKMDFDNAVEAVETQKHARITKIALFALTSLVATVGVILAEAAIVAWPVTLAVIAVVIIASAVIYRLHTLDDKYIEGLDDQTRSNLVRDEIEKIFHSTKGRDDAEVENALRRINKVLGNTVFDDDKIEDILLVNSAVRWSKKPVSIAETAKEQMVPIDFSCRSEWVERNPFGSVPIEIFFEIEWSQEPSKTTVIYQRKAQSQEVSEAPQEPETA